MHLQLVWEGHQSVFANCLQPMVFFTRRKLLIVQAAAAETAKMTIQCVSMHKQDTNYS